MTHMQQSEFTQVAADFVELMRGDFERSFDMRDFLRYVRLRLGYDADESEAERVAFWYFGNHYDLSRWSIGSAWSFRKELEGPEPPGSEER